MAGTTNMVIAELTRYASLIAGIVRDSRKPGAGVRRNVFVATMQQLESDLDDLRRTADLGDAAHSVMETASALNHAQANPESMATFLRPAQVSIATAIKQYRRQHSAGQSLKSTAIKTNQHVTLPDGKRAVVTGVALGSDGEPLVRVKAVKAIDWRSTLLALQPIVQGAIAAAQRGVFTSKEERIFTRASAMLKRASVGVGAGIPKEAANFARTAQQASDSAKRYGQLASLPDDQHKPGEKETWLRTYAHTASAVMTYLKEAINAIPATRTVTKSADVNGGRYVLKNFIPQLKRIAFSGHNKLLKSPQNQHLAEQVQGELKNIINLISQVRGFIELDLAAYRQLRAEVSEFMNTQDFAESAQYVGRYVQKLEKDLKQALAHSAKSADVIVLAARDVTPVKATPDDLRDLKNLRAAAMRHFNRTKDQIADYRGLDALYRAIGQATEKPSFAPAKPHLLAAYQSMEIALSMRFRPEGSGTRNALAKVVMRLNAAVNALPSKSIAKTPVRTVKATDFIEAAIVHEAFIIAQLSKQARTGKFERDFNAMLKRCEARLDSLRKDGLIGDAAQAFMETASFLNHAQANPKSAAVFLRNAQMSIATAIKQYRRWKAAQATRTVKAATKAPTTHDALYRELREIVVKAEAAAFKPALAKHLVAQLTALQPRITAFNAEYSTSINDDVAQKLALPLTNPGYYQRINKMSTDDLMRYLANTSVQFKNAVGNMAYNVKRALRGQ